MAGPILDGDVRGATNLPWADVLRRDVSAALGGVPVRLLNDLEALAWGIDVLYAKALHTSR